MSPEDKMCLVIGIIALLYIGGALFLWTMQEKYDKENKTRKEKE
jgi:uncharacterized membrane protein